jgi:predicted ATPase with chaperone activity
MSTSDQARLLASLAGKTTGSDKAWEAVKTTNPVHEATPIHDTGDDTESSSTAETDDELDTLFERIDTLTNQTEPTAPPAACCRVESESQPAALPAGAEMAAERETEEEFFPPEPTSLREAGLNDSEVEELILKYLLARGEDTGRGIADQVKLPYMTIEPLLRQMKQDQMLIYRGTTSVNDYVCQLSDIGRERARRHNQSSTYFGCAPVPLDDYIAAVHAQSLTFQDPSEADLRRAFEDLLISTTTLNRLGPAINSGRGLFLHGWPGNGKTSIAERVTKYFGEFIWIPRALGVNGEIVRLYDPIHHHEAPPAEYEGLLQQQKHDTRWIRIYRPTIVVGGELTIENLELSVNPVTGVDEAPVQLKSNCGTLVIDDFGRQRMSTDELLNRWIVPLEKRHDFLNMASGKKVRVPFDQLVIFATNLEPRDLVDEAFLRRIPYKVEIVDPTEEEFRELFMRLCVAMNIPYSDEALDYLVETHYKETGRPFRACRPRDLLLQVRNYCKYRRQAARLTLDNIDFAVATYFAAV